jgi:hypothetical protein
MGVIPAKGGKRCRSPIGILTGAVVAAEICGERLFNTDKDLGGRPLLFR